MDTIKCYKCERIATSKEHIPPICLFPEIKDTKGFNFRKNLITVPSCEIHNSKKSDDDEFLMLSLSGLIKNNHIGNFHQLTKADRALKRKNKGFLEKQVLRNHRYGKIRTTEGKFRIVSIGNPNAKRLINCLEHIAYGLYFNEFKEKFEGETEMLLEFIEYTDDNMQTLKKLIKKSFEEENKLDRRIKGENPMVFYYQFQEPDTFGLIALRMVFYEAAEVYVSFKGENAKEPFDLGIKLMLSGCKTTFEVGKEKFEFNK